MKGMSKVITAEYDAKENVFRLEERPEGVADHEKVELAVVATAQAPREDLARPWLAFQGCLPPEDADELEAILEEEFPTEK